MPHRIALAKSTICWMFGSGTFGLTVAAIDPATAGSIVTAILFAVCGAVIHWGGKLIELKKAIRISRAQTDGEIAIIYAKTRAAVDVIEAKGGGAKVAEKLDRNFAATQSLVDNLPSKDDLVDAVLKSAQNLGIVTIDAPGFVGLTPNAARNNQVVLVVEDDAASLNIYSIWLRRAGFAVLPVDSVAKALVLLGPTVSAVLLDLRLADGPGETLIDRIEQTVPPQRVVVLTGLAADDPRVLAVTSKVATVLIKPVRDFDQVVRALDGDPAPATIPIKPAPLAVFNPDSKD